jgi:hypothetical protein
MKELYSELLERLKHLESKEKTNINDGRIAELQLIIVRIQQMMIG